ncbi:dihydrolipoyl dehydrogenase family protein [Mycoplasmopsis gallinarum]
MNYDLIIIGWGKGGKTLASQLPETWKIALIEKDPKMFGGTCINIGCLPSKSLVNDAHLIAKLDDFNFERNYEINNDFFKQAIQHKNDLVSFLNQKNYEKLAFKSNVDIYVGNASFINENQIQIKELNGNILNISASKIIINTGAKTRKLNFDSSWDTRNIIYSEEALNLNELPKKLLIVGAGFIGLEFASFYANFGSEVTILQNNNLFLPSEDEDNAHEILKTLSNQNISINFNSQILDLSEFNEQTKVTYTNNDEVITEIFDKILISIGRIANVEDLNLAAANVELSERKEIKVNDYLQTSNPNIYAIGDVKGGTQFTYISLDDSRIVFNHLNNDLSYSLKERNLIPIATFISPTYARVGLTEKEIINKNIPYKKKFANVASIPKARVIRETKGFVKILIDENDYIIGASLFMTNAEEVINLIAVAIKNKIKSKELKNFIYTHPTMTESLNEIL